MSKKHLDAILRGLLWYVIALAVSMITWACLECAFYGTAEPRPWDAFVCLVCAFISRLFAEYMTREK